MKKGDLVYYKDFKGNNQYGVIIDIKDGEVWANWEDSVKEALKATPIKYGFMPLDEVYLVKQTLKQIMERAKND